MGTSQSSEVPLPEGTQQPEPPKSSIKSDGTLHKIRTRSYIGRHWHGQLSLPISYWLNGFLLTSLLAILLSILIESIFVDGFVVKSPKVFSISVIAFWTLIGLVTVWQLVGIWRSANNYNVHEKPKVWGYLAKLGVVLGVLGTAREYISTGIPQIREFAQIAIGRDPVGAYRLRVLRDATELEIAGGIGFGLTDEVRRTLDAHPTIRIVHLNSQGGRVAEARKLRDLISARKLATYTASGCLSACTVAYAAGSKRLIAKGANLGFHQYSFPGVKPQDFLSESKKTNRIGFPEASTTPLSTRPSKYPATRCGNPRIRSFTRLVLSPAIRTATMLRFPVLT